MGSFQDLVLVLLCSVWCVFHAVNCNAQLQSSQTLVLLQLKKHLEYPKPLDIWKDRWTNLCSSTQQVNVSCNENFVTELLIIGDKTQSKFREEHEGFDGYAIQDQTLSQGFSMDSFVATLARLTNLRVLKLVSLGIWGPLPDRIHRLYDLQHLDLSSNFLYGSIPPKISTMVNLQTLNLGDNFFNGTIPTLFFNSSSNLSYLSLKNNKLKGHFPNSILGINTLNEIDISNNNISGGLQDFNALSNLEHLDLSWNSLDSTLPPMPKGLKNLFLSRNSFSGEIPKQYGKLSMLQMLDVSFNSLTGTVPAEIFNLPNISLLNISSNMLSGTIKNNLRCSIQLRFVDISNNKLMGGLPDCLIRTGPENDGVVKSDGNCLSGKNFQHQHALSYCKEEVPQLKKESHKVGALFVVGVIVGILVMVMVFVLCIVIVCKRYYSKGVSEQHLLHKSVQDSYSASLSSEIVTNARYVSEAAKFGREDLPFCRSYSLEELKEATNNFDNPNFMGENLYGKLYRGKLESGIQVVIRCLPLSKKYTIRNFKLRLDLLAKLRHPHLVSLLGHCIDGVIGDQSDTNVFLVYEFVSNGSFQTYLSEDSGGKVYNWSERLSVLISIAKAIHFLHTGMIPGFFKNRLKTNNILINEHWMAKLSDYGLSIISEETDACGVNGESPDSMQMKRLEDDVYSFGFIILEALVGPSLSAKREALMLHERGSFNSQDWWKQIVDPIVMSTCSKESLSIVISISNKCISPESWSRPSIEDVLWNLQYASQVQATADGV
ncbi:probable inactive leucine-rich repeat receptor-like protein kinase At3g03770 isoform X1 [Arachis stenosperma]|uniref:probable inactive leucine-rich repeat receptor-like protein kinase At3g03770 isoform X1 n=1 Tax=Arachis stenosperma TaxID=217475 RepID=UPI0025AD1538|nr:probable inactive leucine-rich repeat receptor-like protein kinase At3g03770 isoform X1 [Arachis stenosperma]XP_057727384.1 probable inactive leucine-rich repeat receptor-like protein kinase At3g03770 isoform X1 [Arachis stenosperma]XP_057727385.1 probable inactive leucine-rich repeat receptor-like protein kinase At3g03770 isoform X1 [Arachis stenosperma]XP_057727386.1 probable inactive leucine-rich repeat receptor-like protein kinase At3g03770 isoform X1 [Arachis stenosperma]